MGDFHLSAQLIGHEGDVRSVSFPTPDLVVSASRDCSVRAWKRTSTKPPEFESQVVSHGSDYINSVTFLPPSGRFPEGLIVSGGKDTIIEVRSPSSGPQDNAERLLVGHANNICSLHVSPKASYFVSGGWDGQARVWSVGKWESEVFLADHEDTSVWAVLALDENTVVTGSSDKNIRIFDLRSAMGGVAQPRSVINTPDIVRALCRVPEGHPSRADIASASNDGILRLWKLNGQMIAEMHGHESFVYSLASLPTGELVSAGEDRTLRVWKGLDCVQTITHPAISVWGVAVCPETGDLVTGASDNVARVFTRDPARFADSETLAAFEEAVKGSAIPHQQVGGINKEKLPGPDFLTSKSGTKDGQVQMIKELDGSVTAHTWSMGQQQWVNVGTVVDTAGSSGKKVEYLGKSYDYVFDVDIEDGKPPLKLPFNLSDNPYDSARKFLEDNELPISYLEEVVNFIRKNTEGSTLGVSSDSGGPDPLGTEARYRPGDGEGATSGRPKAIPQTSYLNILAAKHQAIYNKIISINANMVSSGRKDAALNPTDQTVLLGVRESLETSKPVTAEGLSLVIRAVRQWSYPERLPGLDLLRCMVTTPLVAEYASPQYGSIINVAIDSALGSEEGQPPSENCVMMALRLIANMFGTKEGREVVVEELDTTLSFLEQTVVGGDGGPIVKTNRNLAIAAATVIINYAVLAKTMASDGRLQSLPLRSLNILAALLSGQQDSEVLFRSLVGLGTIIPLASRDNIKTLSIRDLVASAKSRAIEPRVKAVADECLALLK